MKDKSKKAQKEQLKILEEAIKDNKGGGDSQPKAAGASDSKDKES
jgi:hypothetical protein